jgi:hypothetical protein
VRRPLTQQQQERGLGETLDARVHVPAAAVMVPRARPASHCCLR